MNLPIYLIGYMGSGKTTAGRLLAEKLGWQFVDLDEAFSEIHGLSTADYIRQYGLAEFRKKEKYVVEDLADTPIEKVVYATGGGYPTYEDNMECLAELGTSFYIRWSPEHLAKRLMLTDLHTRPVLQGNNEEEILDFIQNQLPAREPFYRKANYTIDAPVSESDEISETDDEEIAEELYQFIKNYEH